jgi:hypothetical protein
MTDSFPLSELLQQKELRIVKDPVVSACIGYNEKYYIDRTFQMTKVKENLLIYWPVLNRNSNSPVNRIQRKTAMARERKTHFAAGAKEFKDTT